MFATTVPEYCNPAPLLQGFCVRTTTHNSSEHLPQSNRTPFSGLISCSHLEAGPEPGISQKGGLGLAQSHRELSWVTLCALTPSCMTAPARALPQVSAIPLPPSTLNPKSLAAGYRYLWKPCFQLPFPFSGTLTQFLQGWYSSYPRCPRAPQSCRVGKGAAWGAAAAGSAALPARTAFVSSGLRAGIWGSAVAVLPARELGRASFAEVSKLSKQHLC